MSFELLKQAFSKRHKENRGKDLGPRSQILLTPNVDPMLPDEILAFRRREEREKLRQQFSELRGPEVQRLYGRLVTEHWGNSVTGKVFDVHCDDRTTFMEQEEALGRFYKFLKKLNS